MFKLGCIDAASAGRILRMSRGKIFSALMLTVVLTAVLLEFEIAPSTIIEVADPEVEAQYRSCYEEKDEEIHATAFGTIDNPDVQKEFITSNRARAAAECRDLYPAAVTRVEEPGGLRLKLRRW